MTDEYFQEIESHFAARRGTPFILSAKDWALMTKWRDEGVPLPVVIEAIDQVFEKNETSGRRKVISSLNYCKHAVKELWNDRRQLFIGSDSQLPESAPADMLSALAQELEAAEAPPEIVATFADRVRGLTAEKSVPKIEEHLIEIERGLIEELLSNTGIGAEVRNEASRALRGGNIDEKTRARTEEANVRRLVRERFGLPRLTLFR